VATDLYTHTQVLTPDVSVLVEPHEDTLARGILSVLEDPQLGASLGARARQLFETSYSYENYLRKTEEALRMAAGQRNTPHQDVAPQVQ
jgi:glycosyltransferase involved in cell wall biosynthesis